MEKKNPRSKYNVRKGHGKMYEKGNMEHEEGSGERGTGGTGRRGKERQVPGRSNGLKVNPRV